MALVSGVHKKRQRAVIQTQPSVSFLGMCCVCECVCASSRDTVVVLSGLRNGTLQPRFPRSLAQHATVTARQLALRLWRGVRSQRYVSECACVCVCIVVVCVCLFLCDWVCSNVAQMYESEILPGVYNVFLLRL